MNKTTTDQIWKDEGRKLYETDKPTEAERADRRVYYARLFKAGHKRPVSRSPYPLDQAKAKMRELLAGHKVERCVQRYLAPADESRAERGLETGLITRERSWLEVDGKRLPSARPTLDEIREAML